MLISEIDELVAQLGKEQFDDDAKKEIFKFAMNSPNKFYNFKLYKPLRSVSSPRRSALQ